MTDVYYLLPVQCSYPFLVGVHPIQDCVPHVSYLSANCTTTTIMCWDTWHACTYVNEYCMYVDAKHCLENEKSETKVQKWLI